MLQHQGKGQTSLCFCILAGWLAEHTMQGIASHLCKGSICRQTVKLNIHHCTSAQHTACAGPGYPCYKQLPQSAMADELLPCLQDFSFESSSAAVRAYASYSDGFMNDVTDLPGLNITSLAPLYLSVNDSVGNITVSSHTSLLALVDIPCFDVEACAPWFIPSVTGQVLKCLQVVTGWCDKLQKYNQPGKTVCTSHSLNCVLESTQPPLNIPLSCMLTCHRTIL